MPINKSLPASRYGIQTEMNIYSALHVIPIFFLKDTIELEKIDW